MLRLALLSLALVAPLLAQDRPNLIFILTDDQRFDMMGNVTPYVVTPEMDRIVAEGVRFNRAFVTTPICMASRATILSGLWERTHRYTGGAPAIDDRYMLASYPKLLRDAGYQTGYVGKWHVEVNEGIIDELFDSYVRLRHPYEQTLDDGAKRHLTDLTGDLAIEYLDSTEPDKPFNLSVSFNAPHAEDWHPMQYIPAPGTEELYQDFTVPPPILAELFDALPAFLGNESMNRHRYHWRFDNERKRQLMTKNYYRLIAGVDRVIGRLRAKLQEMGVADNTVIMLMGDNGYFLGDRGWAGKWKPHELSLRVPLIVYDPGLSDSQRGAKTDAMALNVDVPSTLLDYAGVEIPEHWQGESLVPLIRGEQPSGWRTEFFHEHIFTHPTIADYEGIRTERYKYARYIDQDPVYEEMYDLEQDPDEAENLAKRPRYYQLLRALRQRCSDLRDEVGGIWIPWPDEEMPPARRKVRKPNEYWMNR